MKFPIKPTVFKENPYQESWYERDFIYSPDGNKEYPDHHCKVTFETSKPFITTNGVALDIGCRDGEYARYLQHHFRRTYCFDPRLRLATFPFNVNLSRTTHFNCALGDETTEIMMFGGTHDPTHSKPHTVPCFRLDQFRIQDISYIKIDVEGFETKVLAGGEQLIARDKPLIVIEQNDVTLEGEAPYQAKAWLEERGYIHVATCPRGWDFIMQHESWPPAEDTEARELDLHRIGGFYLPRTDIRFSKLGNEMADYQKEQRDAAFTYLKNRRCALDVGANIGIFSRHFAETFERVVAIEPLTVNVACLERNVPDNVKIVPAAVGDTMGAVKIYQTTKTLGNAFVANHADVVPPEVKNYDESRLEDTDMITIDSLGLEDVDLMKLDIQGAELIALKGAEQTIRRCRPVIMVEEKAIGDVTAHIGQVSALLESFGMVAKERVGADCIFVFE